MQFNHVVTSLEHGRTLKSVMSHELNMSSGMIKRVKLYGIVEVNGIHANVTQVLNESDVIYAFYDDDVGKLNEVPNIPILYEDDYFAVVDKPTDMVTHPTHGHLDDSLLTKLNSSNHPLHPVMRLDRETSGLVIVAKTGHIHKLFTEQKIKKIYAAAVYGIFEPEEGIIDAAIKRREGSVMIRDACLPEDPGAHECLTLYKTLAKDTGLNISLVQYELKTGRCHQIRVHSTFKGHPLVGDGLYGPCSIDNPSSGYPLAPELDAKCGRLALHARQITFAHPLSGEKMVFESKIPDEILGLSPEFVDHFCS
jgi:23S rRNA pseudouridine1911/1915/1917 synthase